MSAEFDYSFDNGVTWTHCAIGSFIVPGIRTVLIKYAGPAKSAEPCPDAAHMAEHACTNRRQCWEPCGELGHSAEHAKRAPQHIEDAIRSEPAPAEPTKRYWPTSDEVVKVIMAQFGYAPVEPAGTVVDERAEFCRKWKLAQDGFGLERDDNNGNYVTLDDAASVLHAHLAQQAAAPAGWQIVPIKPTEAMIGINDSQWHEQNKWIWDRMLAAAPTSPASAIPACCPGAVIIDGEKRHYAGCAKAAPTSPGEPA